MGQLPALIWTVAQHTTCLRHCKLTVKYIKKLRHRDLKKMIRSLVERIVQKSLSLLAGRRYERRRLDEEEVGAANNKTVPADVMDGQFAVLAIEGKEAKRFILEIDYLADPEFLELLDRAREEYGFGQQGALSVPCRPQELEKIQESRSRRNSLST
ncbi:auxin-responsive protein SAUR71-like [Neltuma alba]|uniref:auxin-responsive protein SAUR71-like n=1 Tax=Neltuma alba TaxID=207710 RepID=UPI0010A5597D|nr:auxin-responsive protein SAUR71-like [Prosopis alba]